MRIAWVKSSVIVANIVIENANMSLLKRLPTMKRMAANSFMRQAVMIKTPAKAQSGILAITGASRNMESNNPTAWIILTIRV